MSEATGGWIPDGTCAVFVCDVSAFGDPARTDNIRYHVRASLYAGLRTSFDAVKIPFTGCYREDRGDGVLVAVPPTTGTDVLLTSLADQLRAEVRRHNEVSSQAAQMRLRVAVHTGEVRFDGYGLLGTAVNHTFRILDAAPFKDAFRNSTANVGLVVSDRVYDDVVRPGLGLVDPADYRRISVEVKETVAAAWINVPGGGSGLVPTSRAITAPDPLYGVPAELTLPDPRYLYQDLFNVVDCLLAIPMMMTERGREQVVGALSPEVAGVIPRCQGARADTYEIVRTCLDYPGGLQQLLHVIGGLVGPSLAMRDVEKSIARLLRR